MWFDKTNRIILLSKPGVSTVSQVIIVAESIHCPFLDPELLSNGSNAISSRELKGTYLMHWLVRYSLAICCGRCEMFLFTFKLCRAHLGVEIHSSCLSFSLSIPGHCHVISIRSYVRNSSLRRFPSLLCLFLRRRVHCVQKNPSVCEFIIFFHFRFRSLALSLIHVLSGFVAISADNSVSRIDPNSIRYAFQFYRTPSILLSTYVICHSFPLLVCSSFINRIINNTLLIRSI